MSDRPDPRRPQVDSTEDANASAVEQSAERDADWLVQLLGKRALADLDPTTPASAPFLDWWASELRDLARSDPAAIARADAFEERMRRKVAQSQYGVRMTSDDRRFRPSPVEGTVAGLLDAAASARCAPALDLRVAAGVGRDLWDETCTSWIELPDDVRSGQHIALTVAGDSMEPLLNDGDTILVKIGSTIERDTVVVARRPDDGYVVKRVARLGAQIVELASLHPGFPSIRIPRRDDLILGTVLLCWRRGRHR